MIVIVLVLLMVPAGAMAQGGPPLMTDDPDTPGPGRWEINLANIVEKSQRQRRLEAPLADVNYGVGERIQLKFELPWLTAGDTGTPAQTGAGNSRVGVKWRFLGGERQRLAWSTYPQLEINTGRSMTERGFLERGLQLFVPTELTLQVGHLELNGEVGRNFAERDDGEWSFGLAAEVEAHPRFELLGELHGERSNASPTELVVNVGGRQKITRQTIMLVAVGRGVSGSPEDRLRLRLYVGVQVRPLR